MARSPIRTTVSLAFVDLFACGLGALLQIWVVLLTMEPTRGVPGRAIRLQLEVSPVAGGVAPSIGVSAEWKGGHRVIAGAAPAMRDGKMAAFSAPTTGPGQPTITVTLIGQSFVEDDRLFVFLTDLNQLPYEPAHKYSITLQRILPGKTEQAVSMTISLNQPCIAISLDRATDPDTVPSFRWKPVP